MFVYEQRCRGACSDLVSEADQNIEEWARGDESKSRPGKVGDFFAL
jgi:hypothetical protein